MDLLIGKGRGNEALRPSGSKQEVASMFQCLNLGGEAKEEFFRLIKDLQKWGVIENFN